MFVDDTSLFSVVHEIDTSANNLNHDLEKNSEYAFQWKMRFNPDPTKQAQEIIFNRKKTVSINTVTYFNNTLLNSTAPYKHLGMILDSKLSYKNHLKSACSRLNKTIGTLRKLQPTLPGKSLVTIYKSLVMPRLDHGDVNYDRASNESCQQSLESLQRRAAIAISWAIRETSSEKPFFKI